MHLNTFHMYMSFNHNGIQVLLIIYILKKKIYVHKEIHTHTDNVIL